VRIGHGPWAIVEADESDKSHLNFHHLQGVLLTNIEEEHMDNYEGPKDLFQCFEKFLDMPQQFAVACGDDPGIQTLLSPHSKVITYGTSQTCEVRAAHIRCTQEGMIFDVQGPFGHWQDVTVKLWGKHNVLNALGVLTAAWQMGLTSHQIREGLSSFPGVQRRLTSRGVFNKTVIIDDYAHHPTEIKVVLETLALMGHKKILAICQPHRYTRLRDTFHLLIDSFSQAARVVLLPVYSAGEQALPGIDASWIVTHLIQRGQQAEVCEDVGRTRQALEEIISQDTYDVAVFLGAGNITDLAFQIGQGLKEAS
jgi:UDP-N-acetylmuramate--alanine ligase